MDFVDSEVVEGLWLILLLLFMCCCVIFLFSFFVIFGWGNLGVCIDVVG